MMPPPLPRHIYPWYITAFCLYLLSLFLYSTITFFVCDLQQHYHVKQKLTMAEQQFVKNNYADALQAYWELTEKYTAFPLACKRIAQCSFALTAEIPELYDYGTSMLANKTYSEKEIEELASYLPTAQHKALFKSEFIRT